MDAPVIKTEKLSKRFGDFVAVTRSRLKWQQEKFSASWVLTAQGKPPPCACFVAYPFLHRALQALLALMYTNKQKK